ncbi:MAG: single-stranded DNA-binding protein [Luteibacter jiangsuensis]
MAEKGKNLWIGIGNLGKDPETRYTGSGTAITTFRMATSSTWKDADGQKQERTEWHTVKAFGKLGEIVKDYASKGRKVYVQASVRYDSYEDKDGITRYTTEMIADEVQFLDADPSRSRGEAD